MKKICSILLAVFMFAASFTATAATPCVTADDITIETSMFDLKVTVETEKDGIMTAMIRNEDAQTRDERFHGAFSNRTPEVILDASNQVTGYRYVFNLSMLETVPTDTYTVVIAFSGDKASKNFNCASLADRLSFYDTLDAKAAGEIKDYFAANPMTTPVDVTFYNSLDTGSKTYANVNDKIAELTLATGVEETDSVEQKMEKLAVADETFTAKFSELMKVAKLDTATNDGWETVADSLLGTDLDDYYYKEATAGVGALDISGAYSEFMREKANAGDFSMAEYSKAFDKSTLTYIEKTSSFGMLKSAFLYYEEKGSIAPDMTNIGKLVSDDNDSKLWRDVMAVEISDCATLIAETERIAKEIVEDPNYGVTGGVEDDKTTGIGGGGSLGGGGSFGGGGSSKPTTPVDPTPVEPEGTFSDIASVEWAKEAIEALAEKGIINGRGDGKFAPNDSVTREEFVKIIIGAFDLLNEDAKADFGDVGAERWSYAFIATANELGIVTGDGENFNPTGAMSRQDMAVVIFRTAEKLGLVLSGDAESFADSEEIADYAKDAIKALTANGIVNGMGDGTFAPKATVTRAQAAKVIYGLMVLCGGGK